MDLSDFCQLINGVFLTQRKKLDDNGFDMVDENPYIFSKFISSATQSKPSKKMISLINEIFKHLMQLLVDIIECVEVRQSTIPDSNNGIFAIYSLQKNSKKTNTNSNV
jgi:hypothetical protein